MKKAKLNRMQIDILKMSKATDLMVMRAGVELIMKCTVNYFECEDTAFYKPYMQTATWAMQFFDRFYEKLVDGEFINPEIFAIAESKFNYLVSQAITLKHRNIGFNLLNEREKLYANNYVPKKDMTSNMIANYSNENAAIYGRKAYIQGFKDAIAMILEVAE